MKSEILLDAIGEISEKYIREAAHGSRRARPWLGTAITAAAAVLIIGVAAVAVPRLTLHPEPAPVIEEPVTEAPVPAQIGEEPVAEVPVPAQTGEEPVGETLVTPPPVVAPLGPIPDEAVGEGPAGPVENENILWYHALTLTAEAAAFDPPETVELGVFRDAVFTEEEIDAVVQRLLDAGWEDMTSTNYEGMELIRPMYLIREDDIKDWRDTYGKRIVNQLKKLGSYGYLMCDINGLKKILTADT